MTPSLELLQAKPIVKYLPTNVQQALQILCDEFSVNTITSYKELWRCIDYVNYECAAYAALKLGECQSTIDATTLLKG